MPLGYTNRSSVELFVNRTFPEVSNSEFDDYISQAEAYINNFTGYNAQTTFSGMLMESITREKLIGKIDPFNNLVLDIRHGPVRFDEFYNPTVTLVEVNIGSVHITLQLTDGTTGTLNTILSVSENRKKIIYPSLYFFPAIATVTPTAKVNLYNMRDIKFFVDVSYVGGYAPLPGDVKLATNHLVAESLIYRDNAAYASRISQGTYSIDFQMNKEAGKNVSPGMAKANTLLQPYVRNTW